MAWSSESHCQSKKKVTITARRQPVEWPGPQKATLSPKKKLQSPTLFFGLWLPEDRATPLAGVALINVSQFFFQQITGTRCIRTGCISQAHRTKQACTPEELSKVVRTKHTPTLVGRHHLVRPPIPCTPQVFLRWPSPAAQSIKRYAVGVEFNTPFALNASCLCSK